MADLTRLGNIATSLESLAGLTPEDGLRREKTEEAKLQRINNALTQIISEQLTALSGLSDVADSLSPSSGESLIWNGTSWTSGVVSGDGAALQFDDLTDVSAPSPATGDVVKWDGSAWTPSSTYVTDTDISTFIGPAALSTYISNSELAAHTNSTTAHGTASAIVGVSDSQTLSNKSFSDVVSFADSIEVDKGSVNGEIYVDINQRGLKLDMQNKTGAYARGLGIWNNFTRYGGLWFYGTDGTNLQRIVMGTEYNDDTGVTYEKSTGWVGIATNSPGAQFDVNGTIRSQNNVFVQGDVYMNHGGPDGDASIYFYDGGANAGKYLRWDDAPGRFLFSDLLVVAGDVRANGDLYINQGGPDGDSFLYFRDGGSITGQHLKWDDGSTRFEFSANMWVDGVIQGTGDLYLNQAGPEGDASIYFYDGGAPGGERLYWDDSQDRFTFTNDVYVSGGLSLAGNDAARTVEIQEFTSDGTWTKPSGAKRVHILMWGGGGGGGGGAGDSATFDSGGGGGAGAVGLEAWYDADDLGATEAVVVGAAGTGGAAVTSGGGNAGTDGGDSTFNGMTAKGGSGGTGGAKAAGTGGTIKIANSLVIAGPYGLPTDGTDGGNAAAGSGPANKHSFGGGGGGGGGGNNPGITADYAGAAGGGPIFNTVTTGSGGSAGVANGGNGGNGAAALSEKFGGSGGGGGGGNYDGSGGDGGTGGFPGGGGGGGGAGYLAGGGIQSSGAGGDGGAGLVKVISYF